MGGETSPPPPKAKPTRSDAKQPSGDHAAAIARFCDGWKRLYGAGYVFAKGKDGKHVKDLLTAVGAERLNTIIDAYLSDADTYVTTARHPISLLASRVNRYTPARHPASSDDLLLSDRPSPGLRRQPQGAR
ncbi:MAG: hypothetical protein QM754_10740 [Tepidisphaeraceae bacterium]